ncbi:MAG: hypothetical protein WCE80_15260 [Acidimicrobiia bacterium]
MRDSEIRSADPFAGLDERDVEALITGGRPVDEDSACLMGFIADLRTMGDTSLPRDVIDFYAGEAAAAAGSYRPSPAQPQARRGRPVTRLRRKVLSAASTVAILLSASGMAWAADGAVPGDWYYGLDRALESVGIGAGGSAERLQEVQALQEKQGVGVVVPASSVPSTTNEPKADAVEEPTPSSSKRPAFVSELLLYLNSVDRVDGAVVSAIARGGPERGNGPPADKGKPENAGPPADKGKPENAGPPADKGRPTD